MASIIERIVLGYARNLMRVLISLTAPITAEFVSLSWGEKPKDIHILALDEREG